MEPNTIDDAAMFLLHLRLQRDRVTALPHELAPRTIDDAYAVQDAAHRHAGWPIRVLKIGCTSAIAQQAFGINHPIGGRLPTDAVFDDGDEIPAAFLGAPPRLECEIALRIGADGTADAVAPAVEVVDPRFSNTRGLSAESLIADNAGATAVVLGSSLPVGDVDLPAITVTLHCDGRQVASGGASALFDGPLGSLEWALAHERSRGRSVEPGIWVITGTCSGLTAGQQGASYHADFGELGTLGFSLGASTPA